MKYEVTSQLLVVTGSDACDPNEQNLRGSVKLL